MQNEELITQFLALAFMYVREEKSPDFYAKRMHVSAEDLDALLYEVNRKRFVEWMEWLDIQVA